MGKLRTIARRSFLVGSVAIVGGVAFGTYTVKKPHKNPLLGDLEDGEASFNPWVKISDQAVTLITPHADSGQGIFSAQAALIAEELDIEFGQFETSPGSASPAYYNGALGAELADVISTDMSKSADRKRAIYRSIVKVMGLQATGGSSSIPDSFEKLRMAGAVARETLKLAAAQEFDVKVSELKTRSGAVILPDGRKVPYTELAAAASKVEPVSDVTLRDPSQWRIIGKPMMRMDIIAKSTGTQNYGIDLEMPGMVYAAIRTNPRQGAGLKSFDDSAAKSMRGVQKILKVKNGIAVIADNSWRAFQAVNAIECDWETASYPAEMDAHWQKVAEGFGAEHLDKVWRDDGDVVSALDGGDILEAEYRAPYVAHQPLEPLNALVKVTDAQVDIWAGHQIPGFVEQRAAKITGHNVESVHLHNQYMGGSFGHRLEFDFIDQAVEIANQLRGTPVKLTYTREEDFAHDYPRQITMARPRGMVKDGRIEAYDLPISSVSVGRSQAARLEQSIPGPDSQIAAGAWNMPYDIPNYRVSAFAAPDLAPVSSWRSVGASSAGFFSESFFDEMCRSAGIDPLAERLRLCTDPVARKVLEAIGEMSNWGQKLGPNRGRGLAFVNSFSVPVAEVIDVTQTPDGIKIDKVYVAADVGKIIDPVNFENNVKGGVVWALGHAMNCEITYSDGQAEQSNFDTHTGMRMHQCPDIIVKGLENSPRIRGIGEPPVPPAPPALANAIFDATGTRLREMPFDKFVDFV